MFSDYTKNFLIYYNNLSTYYIVCVIMSIIAIIMSWIFHFKKVPVEVNIVYTHICMDWVYLFIIYSQLMPQKIIKWK